MKLHVDPTACQAYGLCNEKAPDLIDLDEWGYAAVITPDVPGRLRSTRPAPPSRSARTWHCGWRRHVKPRPRRRCSTRRRSRSSAPATTRPSGATPSPRRRCGPATAGRCTWSTAAAARSSAGAAATSLTAIGEPVDLVVISVPAASFEATVDEALALGARAHRRHHRRLRRARRGRRGPAARDRRAGTRRRRRAGRPELPRPGRQHHAGLPVVGPVHRRLGGAAVSQSGNLALELELRFTGHGLGFSRFVSFGNQADVDARRPGRRLRPARAAPTRSPSTPRTSPTVAASRRPPPRPWPSTASRSCC